MEILGITESRGGSGIVEALREAKAVVTVEDHNIIGGLGSAITEV